MSAETKQPLGKLDILRAIHTYIESIEKGDLEYVHYTWGDGDSLDRERVRDILLQYVYYNYNVMGGCMTVNKVAHLGLQRDPRCLIL